MLLPSCVKSGSDVGLDGNDKSDEHHSGWGVVGGCDRRIFEFISIYILYYTEVGKGTIILLLLFLCMLLYIYYYYIYIYIEYLLFI